MYIYIPRRIYICIHIYIIQLRTGHHSTTLLHRAPWGLPEHELNAKWSRLGKKAYPLVMTNIAMV